MMSPKGMEALVNALVARGYPRTTGGGLCRAPGRYDRGGQNAAAGVQPAIPMLEGVLAILDEQLTAAFNRLYSR